MFSCFPLKAQVINGYAAVTTFTSTVLTVSSVDEANGTFEDGNNLIVMQMQDNVLGNTTNTASFGDISTISATGRYEICRILSHTESAGLPTTITLLAATRYTYNTGANSAIQVITFPKLGSPNYTTAANLLAKNWNGTTGGVIAFEVDGIFTLAHNITANSAGFRGGSRSVDYYNGTTTCDGAYYVAIANHTRNGAKGEGIYKSIDINYDYARGKILNGGGGGNSDINCGGAGGGNFRAGGDGGAGWNGTASGCSPVAGGLGGIALSSYSSGSRVFMGGGGGGGQQNNTQGSNGGNGGGIILIKAKTLRTTGTCGTTIAANGATVTGATNDGQGGGGAGGSIVLQVDAWSIAGTCPIAINASGGTGGTVNSSRHGGGGGGGQGLMMFSVAVPSVNITITTNVGIGGCNDSGCATRAASGVGPNGAGVLGSVNTSLPMLVKYFGGKLKEKEVVLDWLVEAYVPIKWFEIERTKDGTTWQSIATVEASANALAYEYTDKNPYYAIAYYRLKQIGTQGDITYSNMVVIENSLTDAQVRLYPNPARDFMYIEFPTTQKYTIKLLNTLGQVLQPVFVQEGNKITLHVSQYKKGVYYLQILDGKQSITKKIVLQ